MKMEMRVKSLEGKVGSSEWTNVHRIFCRPGQTQAEAREGYGKPIADTDLVVMRVLIEPKFRAIVE